MHEKKRIKIKVKLEDIVILADSIIELVREIYRLQNLIEIEKNDKE